MQSTYDRTRLMGDDVSPQEQELLVRLMEEAGEVIQAASKTLRWGWQSGNPNIPYEMRKTNREYLRGECDDLRKIANRLYEGNPDYMPKHCCGASGFGLSKWEVDVCPACEHDKHLSKVRNV